MLKRLIIGVTVFAMLCMHTVHAENIRVFLNNTEVKFDTSPQILNDRTMVPMREIFESLGMIVQWNAETGEALAFDDENTFSFAAGVAYININGEIKKLDMAPVILNSCMFVPVRAIAKASGCGVDWDEESRHVLITSSTLKDVSKWKSEILTLTNEIRQAEGLNPLKWSDELAQTAYNHSADMAQRRFFDHINPDGESPADRIEKAGIPFYTVAENIAAGQSSPEAAIEAWMNSEGHRQNMLNPDMEQLGVGIAYGGEYGIYWTQTFAALK